MNIIYELSPSKFNLVAPLFSKVWGDKAMIDSVLEGTHPARVWIDYREAPTAALLAAHGGHYYIVGDPSPGRLRQFLVDRPAEAEIFDGPFTFMLPQHAWQQALYEDYDGSLIFEAMRTFRYSHTSIESLDYWLGQARVPANVRMIDRSLIDEIESKRIDLPDGFDLTKVERTFRDGFGFVALVHGSVAALAAADAVSSWYASIHTTTVDHLGGNGLGTLVSAAFIEYCLSNRLTALWSCASTNLGAVAIAKKLGFEEGPAQRRTVPMQDGKTRSGCWRKESLPPGVTSDATIWMRSMDMRKA